MHVVIVALTATAIIALLVLAGQPLGRALTTLAVKLLPPHLRPRHREEWERHVLDLTAAGASSGAVLWCGVGALSTAIRRFRPVRRLAREGVSDRTAANGIAAAVVITTPIYLWLLFPRPDLAGPFVVAGVVTGLFSRWPILRDLTKMTEGRYSATRWLSALASAPVLRSLPGTASLANWERRRTVPGGRGTLPLLLLRGRSPVAIGQRFVVSVLTTGYLMVFIVLNSDIGVVSILKAQSVLSVAKVISLLLRDLAARRRLGIGSEPRLQPPAPG